MEEDCLYALELEKKKGIKRGTCDMYSVEGWSRYARKVCVLKRFIFHTNYFQRAT